MKTVVVCSGGLDSVTLAYHVKKQRELSRLVSFDYGQRHRNELDFAARTAIDLDVRHDIIDISTLAPFLTGSALTDSVDVPDGHYAEETMRTTVVPNRNAIMLAIAFGIAAGENASAGGCRGPCRGPFHLSGLPARVCRRVSGDAGLRPRRHVESRFPCAVRRLDES